MNETLIPCSGELDDKDRRGVLLAVLAALAATETAQAQDAATVQPRAYRIAFENEQLRVLEFNSRPGLAVCGNGMHSHPAHLTVTLSPGKVRWKLPDGSTGVGENKLGDVFWSEAETHEVENISGKDMRALLVELKPRAGARG
jgi:beta-alanine degradation protein BauB